MPEMTGVQFLEERKKLGIDIPVIILSSIATKGAAVTMQCLELGASDFITKPGGSVSVNITSVGSSIIEKIASYGGKYARAPCFLISASCAAPSRPIPVIITPSARFL